MSHSWSFLLSCPLSCSIRHPIEEGHNYLWPQLLVFLPPMASFSIFQGRLDEIVLGLVCSRSTERPEMHFHLRGLLRRPPRILEDPWVHSCCRVISGQHRMPGRKCWERLIRATAELCSSSIVKDLSSDRSSKLCVSRIALHQIQFSHIFAGHFRDAFFQTITLTHTPSNSLPLKIWIINTLKPSAFTPKGSLQCKEHLWFKTYRHINIITIFNCEYSIPYMLYV